MSFEHPLAECDSGGGTHLTLYANRLVQEGGDSMETVPLAQLAAVRVAFQRDAGKLGWAIALLVVALVLALISGPLQRWLAGAAARFSEPPRPESLDSLLHGVLNVLGGFAKLLPLLSATLVIGAVALLALFWFGKTVLSLVYGATERSYAVYGRNQYLAEFAQAVADQLAVRKN
jgi:hypothetical protein